MTDGERRAYQRGYNRAAKWPEHRPPHPPHDLVRELVVASQTLRNAVDNFLAQVGPGDDMENVLGPGIDAVDEAMTKVGQWLKEPAPGRPPA